MKLKYHEQLKPEETIAFRRTNFFAVTREFNKDAFEILSEQLPVLHLSNLTSCESGFVVVQLSYSDFEAPAHIQSYRQFAETYYSVFKNGQLDANNTIPLHPKTDGKQLISISIGLCSRTEEATIELIVTCEKENELKNVMKKQSNPPDLDNNLKFNTIQDWDDDLSWCPSQCIKKIEYHGRHFILLLHWRHHNTWTAELTECRPDGKFAQLDDKTTTYTLNIGRWKDSELDFAKNSAELAMVEWLGGNALTNTI